MDPKEKLNNEVAAWRKALMVALKSEITNLGIGHNPKSKALPAKEVMTSHQWKKYGIVNVVNFKFPRYMVFVHKGVSRGHPISNPRQAKEWFNPVLERNLDKLADIVADNTADLMVNTAFDKLKIK